MINFLAEMFGTMILIYFGDAVVANIVLKKQKILMADGLNTLAVGLLIWTIRLSNGITTRYAINLARDLAPIIAHAILPVPNKRDAIWKYAWIPVVAPILGAFVFVYLFR